MANPEKTEIDFWKEIYKRLEDETDKERTEGKTDRPPRIYWTLVIKPILVFFKSYIIGGKFLKGRKGYHDSVHRAVLFFAGNAGRHEAVSAGSNRQSPLDAIKKEW